ncbi:MAG: hypothetical protein ABIQ93_11485, partial [Saprospiraceae bacterium]
MKFFRFFSKKDCSRFTDNELLDMLRSGGQEQEKALECLHDRFWDLFSRALDFHISDAESLYEAYADALFALRDRVQADR